MNILKELAIIVTKNKIKATHILGNSDSKIDQFYEGLSSGLFDSDQEASEALYGEPNSGSSYRKLKLQLKNRLINHLFLIDIKQASFSSRQTAFYECYKTWAAVKILQSKNAREASIELAQKVFKAAQKYEFIELSLLAAKELKNHYGIFVGEVKNYEKYKTHCKDLFDINLKEDQLETLYTDLTIHYVNNKATKEELHPVAKRVYKEIKTDLGYITTYKMQLYGGLIEAMIYTTVNDYVATLDVSNRMIRFFQSKPFSTTTALQIWNYQKLVCLRQLKRYQDGKDLVEQCAKLFKKDSFNWFKFQEEYFILCMYTRQYDTGEEIINKISNHPSIQFMPESIQEIWKIYEAYILFVINAQDAGQASRNRQFKLHKFLNETPVFSKDKKGMNVSIMIIYLLFLILQRRDDEAIDKIEAIEKYCTRYLNNDETRRSYYFIKLLLLFPRCNFEQD